MSFPLVLLQPGVRNETQDTELTTVKLTPNAHSQFQTRFVIPNQGSVLDSNSALVWNISWDGFDLAKVGYERVCLKQLAGGLPTLMRARFYIGGREIFSSQDVGHLIHIKRLAADPDYQEEMIDKEIGAAHGVVCTSDGQFKPGSDGALDGAGAVASSRYVRSLGSYSTVATSDKSIQCSVLLSDIFSALESLSLPMALDQMRIEIDWETDFDEIATILLQGDGGGAPPQPAITEARKVIKIENPVLLLDYLTFNEELRAGLGQTLQDGMVLPYVHTSMSSKVIPQNTGGSRTDDVLLALQGKLLMKMYVSHRFANVIGGNTQPYQSLQGRCRSQRGENQSYNLYVNDLAIHDLPVDSKSMQYSFLEMTHQGAPSVMPGVYGDLESYGVAPTADNTVVAGAFTQGGKSFPSADANTTSITATAIKDGQAGTQSYMGFDLSKYDEGSRVVPANAGYRVGSSAVILRLTQDGGGADTPQRDPKTVQVFAEEVRMMQIRGGVVDTMEA
jgi:hypothetical protein